MLRDLPVEEHASRLLQLAQANKRSGYVASPELVSAQLPLLRTHSMLSRRFRAPTLRAHIDLWLARDQIWPGAHADWADLTKTQVETHWAEGNHFDMVRAPNDAGLARAIRRIQEMRCPQK